MVECGNCKYFDESDSYPGTGFCLLHADFIKDYESCDDWEEVGHEYKQ